MKTILTWVLSTWQGAISLVWDIQHSKELPLKLLNRLESLDPLCGPRYEKVSDKIKAEFCRTSVVFLWKVMMTCFSASTSPCPKGAAATLGHHWGFGVWLRSSSFISDTSHALIAQFRLQGLLQFAGGDRPSSLSSHLPSSRESRRHPPLSFTGSC